MRNIKFNILLNTVLLFSLSHIANAEGTLTGTITFAGEASPRKVVNITKDKAICGKETHYDESLLVGENDGLQNVVVMIVNAPEGKDLSTLGTDTSLHQIGCVFTPHVLLVPVGVPLKIFNDDGILHNLHTHCEKNREFNIAQPRFMKKIEKAFKKAPEIIMINCDVHGWMKGYLVVVNHPYNAITNEKGEYTITGLPAGTYQLEIWHEKLGTIQKEATIETGTPARLDVVFNAKG